MAILIASLMLAVAMIPPVTAYAETEEESDGSIDYDAYEGFLGYLMFGLATGKNILTQAYDAIMGLFQNKDGHDPSGDKDEIYKVIRQAYAENIGYASDITVSIVNSILPQDASLWFYTTDSWQKSIEYVVAEQWFKGNAGYDQYRDSILVKSGLPSNAANYMSNWNMTIDMIYSGISQYTYTLGQQDYGTTMIYKIIVGNKTLEQSDAPQQNQLIMLDMTQFVTPTSTNKMVYVDADLTDYGKNNDFCKTIYIMGPNVATITDSDGKKYDLQPGMNDITEIRSRADASGTTWALKSGVYELSDNATYAGPFVPLGTPVGADVHGGMAISLDSQLIYVLPSSSEGVDVYDSNGTLADEGATMNVVMSYEGPDGMSSVSSILVGKKASGNELNIIKDYDGLVQQIATVSEATNNAAQALWEIFDACEAKNQFVKPSSLVINVPGVTVGSAEYKAIYIQAMRQIAAYGTDHEEELLSITTNLESIGLICYGNIYNNGQLWAENVIFTPYITTNDQILEVGKRVDWNGDGFAMLWATAPTYSEWNGVMNVGGAKITDLNTKFSLEITKMVDNGEEISYKELKRAEIQKIVDPDVPDVPDVIDPDDIHVLDAETLIMIILLELAAILILLGILFGFNAFLIIAGIIVAVIAVLWTQAVTSLLLGTLTVKDLVPFGWLL